MKKLIKTSLLTALIGTTLYATEANEKLDLWQIKYKAETAYDDGYTIEGVAKIFEGSFNYENGVLKHFEGTVDPRNLSSGLAVRDNSILKHVFTTDSGSVPTLQFRAKAETSCNQSGTFMLCEVAGEFKVRDEWQDLDVSVYISDYQGRTWLHADTSIRLSNYNFYQSSPDDTLKLADLVEFSVDLLGK